MKLLFNIIASTIAIFPLQLLNAQNQTETLSKVHSEESLPFTLELETAPFSLPVGLQAFASAVYDGKWIFLAGRTNGMHTFLNVGNNFPPRFQNTTVYVVDPVSRESYSRSLTDSSSGLSQSQIDELSVVAPEFFQKGETLYIVGGYGINTGSGEMETKSTLTELNLKNLIHWVKEGEHKIKIRQTSDPLLQVTGGALFQNSNEDPFLLILGQNFAGLYNGNSNGIYTMQIRSFLLNDDGVNLSIVSTTPPTTYPDYRRRDLNVAPIMHNNKPRYIAFAGVFTLDTGVWTVPITIYPNGFSFEPDPNAKHTFKQAMNQYNCATFGLYSEHFNDMYVVFPGGISYGFFKKGKFTTDDNFPFINQITTIKLDKKGHYTQYLMDRQYPYIKSTGSNKGNELLFGAEAQFFPAVGLPMYDNEVIKLDELRGNPVIIGYIVGGIMSTLPNTNVASDSTSSPYIFTVKLTWK